MNMEDENYSSIGEKIKFGLMVAGFIVLALAVLAYFVAVIWVWIVYGNTPRNETPNWVWWLMWNRG
jgi:hypothetical protein